MSNEQTVADLAKQAASAATVSAADPHILAIAMAFQRAKQAGVPAGVLIGAAIGNAVTAIEESDDPMISGLAAVVSLVSTLKRAGILS